MSLFKSSGIILKITSLKENEFLFDVFTYEYGKLKMKTKKSKKEKNLDVGYIINFEVNVKKENTIHEIRNIKIKSEFDYNNKNYDTIYEYLFLLKNISDRCPYHMPIYEIYNIVYSLYQLEYISEEKIIFSHLKILSILGILNENSNNSVVKKILSFIGKESIKNILKLKGLDESLKNELKKLLLK